MVDFLSTPLGDGLLKLAVTFIIVAAAWAVVRFVLRLAGRLAALGCLILIVAAILAAILLVRG